MSTQGEVLVPDEVVQSSAPSSKPTKFPLLTNPLAEESLLQMTTPLPTLPFDMITEILLRLPLKFLMQFKCVCKPWNSLISDRKFARKHLRMSTVNPNLILRSKDYSSDFSSIVYPLRSFFTNITTTNATYIKYPLHYYNCDDIVGSCDGILCLTTTNIENNNIVIQAVLWNPSIRKYKILPSLKILWKKEHSFDIVYGFGYDHITDNYKVVVVFNSMYETQTRVKVKVHTLGTNYWRFINGFPYGSSVDDLLVPSGKFVSGTINWLVFLRDSIIIVSLDLGTESFQEILLPDFGEGVEMVGLLTLEVLRDCLCILRGQDIWLMKEYGNRDSWTKLVTVPHLGSYEYSDDQMLLRCMTKLVVNNFINGTLKSPDIKKIDGLMLLEIYVESLISPCS